MLQKYELTRDLAQKTLKIKEFAIIDKRLKNVNAALLRPEDYALLYEETYESSTIQDAIAEGMIALVAALRTPSFYPNASNVAGIAESVTALYNGAGETSIELFFNDNNTQAEAAAN